MNLPLKLILVEFCEFLNYKGCTFEEEVDFGYLMSLIDEFIANNSPGGE